jgi:hypothetical protein
LQGWSATALFQSGAALFRVKLPAYQSILAHQGCSVWNLYNNKQCTKQPFNSFLGSGGVDLVRVLWGVGYIGGWQMIFAVLQATTP